VEHRRQVIVERVPGALVDVALDALVRGGHRRDRVDLLARDERIGAAPVHDRGAGDRPGAIDRGRDRRAVVDDRHVRVGVDGDLIGDRAAEAEADHTGPAVAHLGQRPQRLERGDRVTDRRREVQLRHRGPAGLHAGLVVAQLEARLRAPEEIGREHDVAQLAQAPRARADVVGDAEDLMDEEHAGAALARRQLAVGVERLVTRLDTRSRAHGDASSSSSSGAWSEGLDPLR
jgi:hypothetical protein